MNLPPLNSDLRMIKSKYSQNHTRLCVQVLWYIAVSCAEGDATRVSLQCVIWEGRRVKQGFLEKLTYVQAIFLELFVRKACLLFEYLTSDLTLRVWISRNQPLVLSDSDGKPRSEFYCIVKRGNKCFQVSLLMNVSVFYCAQHIPATAQSSLESSHAMHCMNTR